AFSVVPSHPMARLDHRLPLVFVTALHQLAAAALLGGLPFLLMAIRLASSPDFVRQLSARFSRLALMSVAIVASAGLILSFSYVGSLSAVYGTSYGAMDSFRTSFFFWLAVFSYCLLWRSHLHF